MQKWTICIKCLCIPAFCFMPRWYLSGCSLRCAGCWLSNAGQRLSWEPFWATENDPCKGKHTELKLKSLHNYFIGNRNCRKGKIQRMSSKTVAKSFSLEVWDQQRRSELTRRALTYFCLSSPLWKEEKSRASQTLGNTACMQQCHKRPCKS